MAYKIAVIYGSVREGRQGIKAARFLMRKLTARGHDATLVDPKEHPLPLLERKYNEYGKGTAPKAMAAVARILAAADGFLIVTGEYNHSMPPALTNLLDHYGEEFRFKPSAIACYSNGPFGGVRAAVHLRAVLAQLGTPPTPTMFPIPAVQDAFDDDGNAVEKAYEKRVQRFLDEFEWHLGAFAAARAKGTPY
ncbi:NAD(P)H-dependent oxidoreductase [Candidatus Woesearchaeota archaeon]|nr:NAD(P)H-dependent oxidoreductase [Candidatus Woesearchaeota archaeon]